MDTFFSLLYSIALLFIALFETTLSVEKDSQLQNRYGIKPPFSAWYIWLWFVVILSGVEEAEGFPLIGTRHLVALPMIIIGRIIEIYISNHWQPTQPQKRYRPFPPSPSIWFIWVWTTLIFLLLFREKTPVALLVTLVMIVMIILLDYLGAHSPKPVPPTRRQELESFYLVHLVNAVSWVSVCSVWIVDCSSAPSYLFSDFCFTN